MRAHKLAALVLFGSLVILAAAVCGGDGGEEGDDGDEPAGEGVDFNVEGLMNVALLEEFVSAVPALQGTTDYSGSGSGTANLGFGESGSIDVFGIQVDYSLESQDGKTINIKAAADPEKSSGTVEDEQDGVQGWTLGVVMDLDVQDSGGGGTLTTVGEMVLGGNASLTSNGDVASASMSTPSDLATHLLDDDGNDQGIVSAVVLSFTNPIVLPPDGGGTGGAPPGQVDYADCCQNLGTWGVDPSTLKSSEHPDELNDQFFPDPSVQPTDASGINDMESVQTGVIDFSEEDSAYIGQLYPCDGNVLGMEAVCPAGATSPVPPGMNYFFSVNTVEPTPTVDELGSNTCNINITLSRAGEPGWQAQGPFVNDLFIDMTDWIQVQGGGGQPFFISITTFQDPIPDAQGGAVIDHNTGRTNFFIPVDQFPTAETFRAGVDCGTPFGDPSGGVRAADTLGGVTSESTPRQLPDPADAMTSGFDGLVDEFMGDSGFSGGDFIRGDANDDGTVNIADGIWILNQLFQNGPSPECEEAADANDDVTVDSSDAVYIFNYRFLDGPPPPAPFPEAGPCDG